VGYGNIGRYTLEALEAAPDFEVAGIVRRNGAENKPEELARYEVVKDIKELISDGLIQDKAGQISLTSKGIDLSNSVLCRFV